MNCSLKLLKMIFWKYSSISFLNINGCDIWNPTFQSYIIIYLLIIIYLCSSPYRGTWFISDLFQTHSNLYTYIFRPRLETLNNFCPSRFSQVCSDLHFLHFHFLQNANYTHLRESGQVCVSIFAIWRKCKYEHTWENQDGK